MIWMWIVTHFGGEKVKIKNYHKNSEAFLYCFVICVVFIRIFGAYWTSQRHIPSNYGTKVVYIWSAESILVENIGNVCESFYVLIFECGFAPSSTTILRSFRGSHGELSVPISTHHFYLPICIQNFDEGFAKAMMKGIFCKSLVILWQRSRT